MTMLKSGAALVAAVLGLAVSGALAPTRADVNDYEFQLVQNVLNKGEAVIAVRLVNKKTGKPVPDAVIIAKRLDMAPDAMAEMVARVDTLPSTEPGVYRFKANLGMEGRWQLSLRAKIQGEAGTVDNKLVLRATQ